MAFTFIQGNKANDSGAVKTITVVLTVNPTPGNLVCVGFGVNVASGPTGTVTCVDSAGNAYTKSPNSPSTTQNNNVAYLFYLLNAPANASKTVIVSWQTTGLPCVSHVDEFHSSIGNVQFDTDVKGFSSTPGTSINIPSITPANAGELLYAYAACDGSQSAPTAGGTLGAWTGSGGGFSGFGDITEYDLSSASGPTAVAWTASSGTWTALAMAFIEAAARDNKRRSSLAWPLPIGVPPCPDGTVS